MNVQYPPGIINAISITINYVFGRIELNSHACLPSHLWLSVASARGATPADGQA